jgi:hypothetical protein
MPIRKLTADLQVFLYRWWLYANGYLFVGISIYNHRVECWVRSLKANPDAVREVIDEAIDGG